MLEPGNATPSDQTAQEPSATDATPDPGAQPADDPAPPAFSDPGADNDQRSDSGGGDGRDRDDDSSGSGRSGGGSGGGGSSGPG